MKKLNSKITLLHVEMDAIRIIENQVEQQNGVSNENQVNLKTKNTFIQPSYKTSILPTYR